MLPRVCSVIDHRWRQNVVKTKKWHTSRRRVCHWCFYHIVTSSIIYYWTDPRQHGIYLFYTMIRKENRPIHIPASYRLTVWGFVLVYAVLTVPNANFRLCSSIFLYLTCIQFLRKKFSTSFLAQSRIMAKTFCKTASLVAMHMTHDGNCCEDFL